MGLFTSKLCWHCPVCAQVYEISGGYVLTREHARVFTELVEAHEADHEVHASDHAKDPNPLSSTGGGLAVAAPGPQNSPAAEARSSLSEASSSSETSSSNAASSKPPALRQAEINECYSQVGALVYRMGRDIERFTHHSPQAIVVPDDRKWQQYVAAVAVFDGLPTLLHPSVDRPGLLYQPRER